jgi:hypothetical protein
MFALFTALLFLGPQIQDYTQRGFIENRGTVYPREAANDTTNAVGETLFRYEGFYSPSGSLQLSGAFDVRIDTHHQVDRGFSLAWQDRTRQRPMAVVRRLSAMYHNGPVTVEAGKQFIRWGKTDILTPTDRFAPRDFLTVVDNDFLAITAARLTYEKGAHTLDLVWSPRFTPSRVPLLNQRWAVIPAGVQILDAGAEYPGGPQSGIRWNHSGSIEYSASFYQGFNHLPSLELTPEGVRRFYPRLFVAGADVAFPLPWLSLKAEAAHFSSPDGRSDEYVQYVIQVERQSGEWSLVGGYAGEAVTSHGTRDGEFAPDRGLTKTILGRAGYTIDTNRRIAMESAIRQNGNGFWIRFEYSQALGQHWRITPALTVIGGEPDDFLGQYRQNSNLAIVVRYSF